MKKFIILGISLLVLIMGANFSYAFDGFDLPFGNRNDSSGWINTNPFKNYCPTCGHSGIAPYYWHPGEDWYYPGCGGEPIYAVADGVVRWARASGAGCGTATCGMIFIRHDTPEGPIYSGYVHLSAPMVQVNQEVKRGQQIATLYNYSGAHLHFEIRNFMLNDGTGDPYPDDGPRGGGYYPSPESIDEHGFLPPSEYINAHRSSDIDQPLTFNGHIDDTFIGEGYQYVEQYRPDLLSQEPNYQYADIISWQHWDSFNIYGMDVSVQDNLMTVNIETNYTPGIVPGTNNITTTYGDLFISNNSWAPDSEVWEYVFDVDTGNLYDIHDAQDQILLSDDVYGTPFGVQTYRHGQEVEIDSRGLTAIGSGSAQKSGDYYSLTFDISNMNLVAGMTLGFHWTMGCANDVIEGAVQAGVPEPSTLLLLSIGVSGMLLWRRRSRK